MKNSIVVNIPRLIILSKFFTLFRRISGRKPITMNVKNRISDMSGTVKPISLKYIGRKLPQRLFVKKKILIVISKSFVFICTITPQV